MFRSLSNSLREKYNPDPRAAIAVLMGSSFCLFVFLGHPEFANPYYLFGVATMVFAVVWSVTTLAFERRR